MDKKDLILLAKEVYPELFNQTQKEIQEQIKQLMEPISYDESDRNPRMENEMERTDITNDAPDRWSKLQDKSNDRLKLLKHAYLELQRLDHVADKVLIEEIGCELANEDPD